MVAIEPKTLTRPIKYQYSPPDLRWSLAADEDEEHAKQSENSDWRARDLEIVYRFSTFWFSPPPLNHFIQFTFRLYTRDSILCGIFSMDPLAETLGMGAIKLKYCQWGGSSTFLREWITERVRELNTNILRKFTVIALKCICEGGGEGGDTPSPLNIQIILWIKLRSRFLVLRGPTLAAHTLKCCGWEWLRKWAARRGWEIVCDFPCQFYTGLRAVSNAIVILLKVLRNTNRVQVRS